MSIDAKLPVRWNGGVSSTVGRTSDGTVTTCLSMRNLRIRSSVPRAAPTSSSGLGWSSVSRLSTSAGGLPGSIFAAVARNASRSRCRFASPMARSRSSGMSSISSYWSFFRKASAPMA